MIKCIAYYKPDGQMMLVDLAPKDRQPGETEDQQLQREHEKLLLNSMILDEAGDLVTLVSKYKDLPYEFIDKATLPERSQRDKWRGSKGNPPGIDNTVVTSEDRRQALEDRLDELHDGPDSPAAQREGSVIEKNLRRRNFNV